MSKYGLTKRDLKQVNNKINVQREYLEKEQFITSLGQVKTLLDVSFSANHSERYYAQLSNKINTMDNMALNRGLKPIFMTITIDGFFRDFYKGDYYTRKEFIAGKLLQYEKHIPNDDIRGFIKDKIENLEQLNVKDLLAVLNHQNYRFLKSYIFKKMKKNNDPYMYVKTVEPHSDGIPHFHILFYVKEKYFVQLRKDFERCFPAPRNKLDKSFQTDIKNASGYVLKYITKSFLDLKQSKELDYIQAWYVKHRIMRCVTSRTTVPQWIYKKISLVEKDWVYLSDLVRTPGAEFDWSFDHNTFYIRDNELNRELIYTKGLIQVYSNNYKVLEIGSYVDNTKSKVHFEKCPTKWKNKLISIPVYKDGLLYSHLYKGQEKIYKKHITDMNDLELIEYYNSYDVDHESYTKYLGVRNLMIDRGLLCRDKIGIKHNFNADRFLFGINPPHNTANIMFP